MVSRKLLYRLIALISMICCLSCERTELVYQYNPYCDITFNTDWSALSEAPSGMSIYCYPQPSGEPVVVRTNSIESATASLPTGEYNVVIFNQDIYDYASVGFRNIDSYSTFEIYVSVTTSAWAIARADSELVVDPAEVAVTTIEGIVVTEDQTNESIEMYHKYGERNHIATYDAEPQKVVKSTGIRIAVEGFEYLGSVKGTISGMSEGFNINTQLSLESEVTHILESWTATELSSDDNFGEITTSHNSFGLPKDTTLTRADSDTEGRVDDDWTGCLYLCVTLRDNKTVIEKSYTLDQSNFIKSETRGDDGGYELYINLEGDDALVLPEVSAESSEGAFDANVSVWDYEEVVDLFLQ